MNEKNKAILQMLICATLWSIAGIFMKLVPWTGMAVASVRSLIAGITIFVYMAITRKPYILNRRILLAGVMEGCVYICFACANKLTTAANAIVLQFISPVFIVVFSALFYHERVKRGDLMVIALTFAGIALFFLDQLKPGYIFGNCVAIAAGAFMALMFMLVGKLKNEERMSAVATGQVFAFLVGLPFAIASKPVFTLSAVGSMLVLGIFQLGISYILYAKSSEHCPALACCLLGALEPLLNPVWVFLFDGERPGIFALIGGVVVIVSITVWCIWGMKKDEENVGQPS